MIIRTDRIHVMDSSYEYLGSFSLRLDILFPMYFVPHHSTTQHSTLVLQPWLFSDL